MKPSRNLFALFMIGGLLLMVILGCGGSSDTACSGTLTVHGRTLEGKGKDADVAKHNTCNHYCREIDADYDARYKIWLDSPKGKQAGSPSKQEAIFKDKDLMDYVTKTCAEKCLKEQKVEAKCN